MLTILIANPALLHFALRPSFVGNKRGIQMDFFQNGFSRLLCAAAFLGMTITQVTAQESEYEYQPIPFEKPLELSRGSLSAITDDGLYLTDKDACHLVTALWGWDRSSCGAVDKIIINATSTIDTLVVEVPNSDGFVTFDDWEKSDRESEVESIWNSLKTQTEEQAKTLGAEIILDDWLVHPTLDQEKRYLYYATTMTWDGEPIVNIKASIFDRSGYVTFLIIPVDSNMAADQVRIEIDQVLSAYTPNESQSYADFTEGDKVATAGVLGVLAALVGVKYGKVLAAGLIAVVIAFAKKLWFLILLPFIALFRKMFSKKE